MNKLILILIITSVSTKLAGQDLSSKTVTIKQANHSDFVPSFETIIFQTDQKELKRIFTNVIANDSVIKLKDIPIGKYSLLFYSNGINIESLDIVVCSKCDNEFKYLAKMKTVEKRDEIWTILTEYPHYDGGKTNLAKDFQNSLNKGDRNILMKTPNFTITFYVTKNNEVCDIAFIPENLSKEVKKITTRGILSTNKWNHGKQHGNPSNEVFTIDKATLMKN